MRNNQNLPNRKYDSNNVNGGQLLSTSPVYNNSRSRTPYRSQSRNGYYNNSISKNNRNQQDYRSSYRRVLTMMEVAAIIETIIIEVELIATTEIVIITYTTIIVDQTRDIRTIVFQDKIHHTTEVITIITTAITIINKETIAETQTDVIVTDNDQIVTIDIILTITETIQQVHQIENKAIDTNQEIAVKMETVVIATIKTE